MSIFWNYLGAAILLKPRPLSSAKFVEFFKLSIPLVDVVWKRLHARFPDTSAKHLLWALHFLKSSNPLQGEIAQVLHTNKKTMKQHVRRVLLRLLAVLPKV
jgi:hypothetical protein